MIFVVAFAMLVLLPCVVATAGLKLNAFGFGDLHGFAFFPPRALGVVPQPVSAYGAERPVTEEFVIRSFAKGLSAKRGNLIQDGIVAAVKVVVRVAVDLADAVADVPAVAEVYPRTRRRGMMLAMLEAKNEADQWMAQAATARTRLAQLNAVARTDADAASAAQDARSAGASAAEAYRRVAHMEAILQGRADAQIPVQPAVQPVPASLAA